ncbi:MAG TPA: AI-2E family transporter [Terriglobales bacterium]|jgi:predicted PurR-regulated permease PerM|nr:AI-2E family transporter [Terriglobales bacterium]
MSELADIHVTPPARPPSRNWPQLIVAVGVVLTLCYLAEFVLAVMLVSILLAFILAPVVDFLGRFRLPRGLASLIAVLLLLALLYGVTYASYNQAANFLQVLPRYSEKIRATVMSFRERAESLNPLRPTVDEKNVVKVLPSSPLTDAVTRGFGSVSQGVFAVSVIPFLVYFMLSWQQHARSATVMLFRMEHRHTAYVTLGLISNMIRSFMVGNLLIGLFMSAVSVAVFGALHVPFYFVVGVTSGFLSLVPYLGLVLALVPPLMVGLGQLDSGDLFAISLMVLALHFFALNVLYPKFLGNRMRLNPLAVTMALLFWGWLWGGMGLILAIPITAAMKIIFDHVDALNPWGTWLGE